MSRMKEFYQEGQWILTPGFMLFTMLASLIFMGVFYTTGQQVKVVSEQVSCMIQETTVSEGRVRLSMECVNGSQTVKAQLHNAMNVVELINRKATTVNCRLMGDGQVQECA